MYGPWTCFVEYGRWPCRCSILSPSYNSTCAHMYRQVSKLAIADKLSPTMQTCSPVVKYNYNSNSNLLSMTSSKVRASKLELLVYWYTSLKTNSKKCRPEYQYYRRECHINYNPAKLVQWLGGSWIVSDKISEIVRCAQKVLQLFAHSG